MAKAQENTPKKATKPEKKQTATSQEAKVSEQKTQEEKPQNTSTQPSPQEEPQENAPAPTQVASGNDKPEQSGEPGQPEQPGQPQKDPLVFQGQCWAAVREQFGLEQEDALAWVLSEETRHIAITTKDGRKLLAHVPEA